MAPNKDDGKKPAKPAQSAQPAKPTPRKEVKLPPKTPQAKPKAGAPWKMLGAGAGAAGLAAAVALSRPSPARRPPLGAKGAEEARLKAMGKGGAGGSGLDDEDVVAAALAEPAPVTTAPAADEAAGGLESAGGAEGAADANATSTDESMFAGEGTEKAPADASVEDGGLELADAGDKSASADASPATEKAPAGGGDKGAENVSDFLGTKGQSQPPASTPTAAAAASAAGNVESASGAGGVDAAGIAGAIGGVGQSTAGVITAARSDRVDGAALAQSQTGAVSTVAGGIGGETAGTVAGGADAASQGIGAGMSINDATKSKDAAGALGAMSGTTGAASSAATVAGAEGVAEGIGAASSATGTASEVTGAAGSAKGDAERTQAEITGAPDKAKAEIDAAKNKPGEMKADAQAELDAAKNKPGEMKADAQAELDAAKKKPGEVKADAQGQLDSAKKAPGDMKADAQGQLDTAKKAPGEQLDSAKSQAGIPGKTSGPAQSGPSQSGPSQSGGSGPSQSGASQSGPGQTAGGAATKDGIAPPDPSVKDAAKNATAEERAAAEKEVTGKAPEGAVGQRAPDPEQTVSQQDLADTGEKSAVQVSPAVNQEVNGSPSAQQDGGGDGKHADRGTPSPLSLEKLKDIAKLIKENVDNVKVLAKDLKDGKLEPAGIDAIVKSIKTVKNLTPEEEKKVREVLGKLTGVTVQSGPGQQAQNVMQGQLTPASLDKVLAAVQSAVPGLDKDKAFTQIKAIPSFAVNHTHEVEQLKKDIQAKGLSPEAAQQILNLAKSAVPGLNDAKFMENINKVVDLYKKNGGNIDKALAELKKLFGKTDEQAKKDAEKKAEDAKKVADAAQAKANEAKAAADKAVAQAIAAVGTPLEKVAAKAAEEAKKKAEEAQKAADAAKKDAVKLAAQAAQFASVGAPIVMAAPIGGKIHTYKNLPTGVVHKAFVPQQVARAVWSLYDQPDEGSYEGRYALTNVPKKSKVAIVIETKFVDDDEPIEVKIHEFGRPNEVWQADLGELKIKKGQWVSKDIELAKMAEAKPFTKIETPLVAHVKIAKYGIEACSIIMVVLNEEFVFST